MCERGCRNQLCEGVRGSCVCGGVGICVCVCRGQLCVCAGGSCVCVQGAVVCVWV